MQEIKRQIEQEKNTQINREIEGQRESENKIQRDRKKQSIRHIDRGTGNRETYKQRDIMTGRQ